MDFKIYTQAIIIILTLIPFITILNFVLIIFLMLKLRNSNKKLNQFLNSNDELSIEKMINNYLTKINKIEEENLNVNNKIDKVNEKLKASIQKVGLVRYNPFEDTGGDLCYCLALLNEDNDGVVLNSIFSREGSYNYAKQITNGESKNHKLSEEEIQALKLALNK